MTDNPVIIFGAGPLGLAALDILESNGRVVYGFLDDNKKLHGSQIHDIAVLGSMDDDGFLKLIGKKCDAFVALDDNRLRKTVVSMLNEKRHVQAQNGVHRNSILSIYTTMGHGNFIDAGVVVGSATQIGNHCLVHMGVRIGVSVKTGDFVQIGAGSTIGNDVVIEDEVFIGSGATIVAGVTLHKGARVGAGSVVISDIKAGATVFGNPAQPVNR